MSEIILVVGAHADDVDFSTSGTMSKWAKEGKEIHYLICTNGDKGGTQNEHTPEELVEIRKGEQIAAANIVGVKEVHFLGRGDGELMPDMKLREDIVRVIRQVKPDKMFSFDPANQSFDGFHLFHPDHRAVAISVFDAIYPAAKNRLYFPHLLEEGLEPHKVNELYFYGTKEPNIWIDISDTIDQKIACLREHKSQFSDMRAEMIEQFVRQRCMDAGKEKGLEYAEAFRMISFPF
ncbi:MAG: PIG-L family deacetylase [Firmicutes bacterium]|nr:PIG-L family deacetylase [Bacillota bacterium]